MLHSPLPPDEVIYLVHQLDNYNLSLKGGQRATAKTEKGLEVIVDWTVGGFKTQVVKKGGIWVTCNGTQIGCITLTKDEEVVKAANYVRNLARERLTDTKKRNVAEGVRLARSIIADTE